MKLGNDGVVRVPWLQKVESEDVSERHIDSTPPHEGREMQKLQEWRRERLVRKPRGSRFITPPCLKVEDASAEIAVRQRRVHARAMIRFMQASTDCSCVLMQASTDCCKQAFMQASTDCCV